jgi:hypothetical protein
MVNNDKGTDKDLSADTAASKQFLDLIARLLARRWIHTKAMEQTKRSRLPISAKRRKKRKT